MTFKKAEGPMRDQRSWLGHVGERCGSFFILTHIYHKSTKVETRNNKKSVLEDDSTTSGPAGLTD
jgi:hypothetical protein